MLTIVSATTGHCEELTLLNMDAWLQRIAPTQQELAWAESIPWYTTFSEGIQAADAQQKPLLLWVMNGHPLGCT